MTIEKLISIRENEARICKDDCANFAEFKKSAMLMVYALYEHDFDSASVIFGDMEQNLGLCLHLTGKPRTAFILRLHTCIGKTQVMQENPEYTAAKSALKTAENCRELGISISDAEVARLKAEVARTQLLPQACVKDIGAKGVAAFINQFMLAYAAQYCGNAATLEDICALEVERKEARKAARRAARAAKKNA